MRCQKPPYSHPTRRSFLHDGSLLLLGAGLAASQWAALLADDAQRRVRIGMVTDLHYADKPPAGSRHYRETLTKIAEAGEQFQKDKPDFVVELGDLIEFRRSRRTGLGLRAVDSQEPRF